MSVSGLCELCEGGNVEDGCDRCGRLVCEDHYDRTSGLCVACADELGGDPTSVGGQRDAPDGVDEYRF